MSFEQAATATRQDVDRICAYYDPAANPDVLRHQLSDTATWEIALSNARDSLRSEVEAAAVARHVTSLSAFTDPQEEASFRTRLFGALSLMSQQTQPLLTPAGAIDTGLIGSLIMNEVAAVGAALGDAGLSDAAAVHRRNRLGIVE